MADKRRFVCLSTSILTALVFCSVLSIHKVVLAQVSTGYCSTKDEVWFKGYFKAQRDYKKGHPYDATSRAVVPTNDYANGYAQGWSDARAGLSASYYNRWQKACIVAEISGCSHSFYGSPNHDARHYYVL